MRPRRTPHTATVLRYPGGSEDSDLWVEVTHSTGTPGIGAPCFRSVWELTDDERARVAAGENIALVVWGGVHPPVAVSVTDDPLGARG